MQPMRAVAFSAAIVVLSSVLSGTTTGAAQLPGPSASRSALALEAVPPAVREVLQAAERDASARPHDVFTVGRFAMLLHAYEQHSLAIEWYARASALEPESSRWAYLGGVSAAALGVNGEAAVLFRRALRLTPEYVPARVRLADLLLSTGDLEAARQEYQHLIERYPELASAHIGLGRTALEGGDPDSALAHYERAIALAPHAGAAHYALALLHRNAGRLSRAQVHLDASMRAAAPQQPVPDPLLEEVRQMRSTARDLIVQGARLGTEGRLAEAIEVHLQALKADPAAAQAHVNLVSLYARLGRADAAELHYHKALQLNSHSAGAHYNYGVLLATQGDRQAAAGLFRNTLRIDPFHPQAHQNLGALLAMDGRFLEAETHFRHALASDPQHRGARFGLARVLLAIGRPDEAIQQLERLVEPEGAETPRYKHLLARAWLACGNPETAGAYAREAYDLARRFGQLDFAEAIDRELRNMDATRP